MKIRLFAFAVPLMVMLLTSGPLMADDDRAALEKKFQQTLTGATLTGHFTLTGQPADKLHEETYVISRVVKDKDDYWMFHARIKYGNTDVEVPLRLEVKWAGDTPMITLTNMSIPLVGTYSARVVIHGDRYAGTWSGRNYGGHLFGDIVRESEDKAESQENEESQEE